MQKKYSHLADNV